ncbi:MAG: AMP-binding protein, partial [Gammaproteobacteria bacterium]
MNLVHPVIPAARERTRVNAERYEELYRASVDDNESFWADVARRIDWIQPFSRIKDVSWTREDLHIRWFEDGVLNASWNCLDRHLDTRGDQVAIIWEGDDPARDAHITYRDLHRRVCRMANVLKELGVARGDRVTIYLPMIPEAAVAMLACARIGAVHSVVFGGFSPDALAGRIVDCESSVLITADQGVRGGRTVPLKANVDEAKDRPGVRDHLRSVLVVRNTG